MNNRAVSAHPGAVGRGCIHPSSRARLKPRPRHYFLQPPSGSGVRTSDNLLSTKPFMKRSIRYSLFLAGVCAALPLTGLRAQDPAATPSVSAPATANTQPAQGGAGQGQHNGKMKAALASLTPAERQELLAARKQAMQDPAVQTAKANKSTDKKGFHRAMTEAMIKADPNVKPILEKMRANAGGHMKRRDLQTS